MENGHPRITPAAATATAIARFSKRNNPDDRDIAYIENELGKKPAKHIKVACLTKNYKMKVDRVFIHKHKWGKQHSLD